MRVLLVLYIVGWAPSMDELKLRGTFIPGPPAFISIPMPTLEKDKCEAEGNRLVVQHAPHVSKFICESR